MPARIGCVVIALIFLFCSMDSRCAESVVIGGGSEGGVYLPLARAISLITAKTVPGISITIKESTGSVENINKLQDNEFTLALAQSDTQYMAVNGYDQWTGKPAENLRYVCSFHPEALTLIASKISGIKSVSDLRGKRVSLGTEGSGQNYNARQVLKASGLDCSRCIKQLNYSPEEALAKLKSGELDAFFFTVGHPNKVVAEAVSAEVGATIIPISGEKISVLLENVDYFSSATIDAKKLYPKAQGMPETISTIGVKALLLTTDKVSEQTIYEFTKSIFNNFDAIKNEIPAEKANTPEEMATGGRIAAYHPGALKYYKEAGLVK